MEANLLYFFSALGAFNGLIMFAYLIFVDKNRGISKILLAGLILALSIRIGKSVFLHFDRDLPKIYLQVGLSACLFIGPFLYFYVISVIEKKERMPTRWKWVLRFLLVGIIGVGVLYPYATNIDLWNSYVLYIIYWLWMGFVIAAGFALRLVLVKFLNQKEKITNGERWLLVIFLSNLIIFLSYFVVAYGFTWSYYLTGPLVFSFFLYLSFFGFFYTDKRKFSSQQPLRKYANKNIAPSEVERLTAQLSDLMTADKLFLDSKLKLKGVADLLEVPPHLLSQLLNDNLNTSFTSYVNKYRINEACRWIKSTDHLSLEGIGYEVGFNSKSTFFATFKKIKGITPADFLKLNKA